MGGLSRGRQLRSPGDLTGFPSEAAPGKLYRVHRSANEAGWWSSNAEGRFDLVRPGGTLYAATDPVDALIECAGPEIVEHKGLPSGWLAERSVTRFTSKRTQVANLSSAGALAFGVTGELASTSDYTLSRRWASAFAEVLGGLRFTPRHVPGNPCAIAIFARSGSGRLADARSNPATDHTGALITRGVTVIGPPSLGALRLV